MPALAVPIALVAWGVNRVLVRPTGALLARSLAAGALVLFLIGILGAAHGRDGFWVGFLGEAIGIKATDFLGKIGAYVVLWTGLLVALLSLLDLGLAGICSKRSAARGRFAAGSSPRGGMPSCPGPAPRRPCQRLRRRR